MLRYGLRERDIPSRETSSRPKPPPVRVRGREVFIRVSSFGNLGDSTSSTVGL
jgi:hypothetical protein